MLVSRVAKVRTRDTYVSYCKVNFNRVVAYESIMGSKLGQGRAACRALSRNLLYFLPGIGSC